MLSAAADNRSQFLLIGKKPLNMPLEHISLTRRTDQPEGLHRHQKH